MNQSKELKEYSIKIPSEIKWMLKALADDDRLGIIIALLKNGKMTFSEMKEKFQLNSSSLTNHLSLLQEGNLVQNFYEKNERRVSSFYDVTDVPEAVVDSLFDIVFKLRTDKKARQVSDEEKQSIRHTAPADTSEVPKIQTKDWITAEIVQQPSTDATSDQNW